MAVEKLSGRSPKRIPSLNGLKAFEVAARHLNFRLAAEELRVTQAAVAQQVRGLEKELGVALFERMPRTLALTGEGRTYRADIQRAFNIISEATSNIKPEPVQVTISTTPTFASKWLIPRLSRFTAANDAVELNIVASERISNFQADGVDLAVRYGRPPFGPGLLADLLFLQEIVAIGSSTLFADKLIQTRKDLSEWTLLHDTHNFWPEFLEQHFDGSGASFKGITFNQTSHAIEAAIAGHGVALATSKYVSEDLTAGRLLKVFPSSMPGPLDFYLVRPRYRQSDAQQMVADWMLSEAQAAASP